MGRIRDWIENKNSTERLSFKLWIIRIEIGNFLIAISSSGLMALGILPVSITTLITLAIILFALGVLGRYIDGVEDNRATDKKGDKDG